jgi:outer membrane biosynthesis protein TonB
MNRLQKKCFVASAGMHLLLASIIVIGPAFSSSKAPEVREINFVPSILVDANVAGGGNPNASPPPAPKEQPPAPQPQPQPPAPKPEPKPPEPKPQPEPAKTETTEPDELSERKARKPQIVTVPTTRPKPKPSPKTTGSDEARVQEKQMADARRKAGQELLNAARDNRANTSGATAIDEDFGPGGGGPAYAGYASWVQSVYQNAWIAPDDTASDAAITKVRVTIANDGRVVSSEIINRSGDSQMDASVQRTLDRVPSMGRPFPEGVKEKQRTYILKFDLKVKRGLA